ncbi:hypothetical protein OAA02_00355, partial [bacterium]|nr:hypothetical protein [bacterium]
QQLRGLWEDAYGKTSLQMEFARIGENSDDTELDYYGSDCQFYLNVERTIYKDIPIKEKVQNEYLKQYKK